MLVLNHFRFVLKILPILLISLFCFAEKSFNMVDFVKSLAVILLWGCWHLDLWNRLGNGLYFWNAFEEQAFFILIVFLISLLILPISRIKDVTLFHLPCPDNLLRHDILLRHLINLLNPLINLNPQQRLPSNQLLILTKDIILQVTKINPSIDSSFIHDLLEGLLAQALVVTQLGAEVKVNRAEVWSAFFSLLVYFHVTREDGFNQAEDALSWVDAGFVDLED